MDEVTGHRSVLGNKSKVSKNRDTDDEELSVSKINLSTSEKRTKEDTDEQVSEDGNKDDLTLVKRNNIAKRFKSIHNTGIVSAGHANSFEVSVAADTVLPKQIGLAKLLKAENVSSITHIKYETPNRVIMQLENKDDAEKLIHSSVFRELGYRCHLTNKVNLTYGVVKYIEMDVKKPQLAEFFKCETQIISVRRLKRLNEKKKWSDSDTVRFCFKSSFLPPYVYGFDCRFKVEPYTFPVCQCTTCWHYGHSARFCPSKKKICPKCSGKHDNCETSNYRCANCKGKHLAFDKSCPKFVKEKRIRRIMSKQNCTYKVALYKYLNRQTRNLINMKKSVAKNTEVKKTAETESPTAEKLSEEECYKIYQQKETDKTKEGTKKIQNSTGEIEPF